MTDPALARYDFLSFVRRGSAAQLTDVDPLSGSLAYRGGIAVAITVRSRGIEGSSLSDVVPNTVQTFGPGDVVGIDPRHVVRTDPRAGVTDFEPNYFASVEFEHPDFPWLFTPAAPDAPRKRLRPWIALVVLAETEFTRPSRPPDPLPTIEVTAAAALPDLSECWAWAHAQVSGGTDDLGETLRTSPGHAISRLLSPRRLLPRTRYHGFVVPTFRIGVLAGRGLPVPSAAGTQTAPAWPDPDLVLPIYYQFEFGTSDRGDFESLARQLVPRVMPPTVGIRPMSVPAQNAWNVPAGGMDLGLSGALRSLQATDTNWTGQTKAAFQQALKQTVDRGTTPITDTSDDPRITPPFYGRWHAGATTLDPAQPGWLNELNGDPRTRTMAGFGTRVVSEQRSQLLTAAWRQLGAILEANQKLRAAQLARAATRRVHVKHFASVGVDTLLSLTFPVHHKMRASPRTIAATIARSRLPVRALSPAFRRIARPLGPIRKRQRTDPAVPPRWATRLNTGDLRVVPPARPVDGLISLEDLADRLFPAWAPGWLRRLLPYAVWIAITIALVLALLILIAGALAGSVAAAVPLAVLVLLLGVILARWLRERVRGWRLAAGARFGSLTADVFRDVPPRPDFTIASRDQPVSPPIAPSTAGSDSPHAAQFRRGMIRLADALARAGDDPPDRPPADLDQIGGVMMAGLDPARTIPARIGAILHVDTKIVVRPADDELEPIMAAPVIDTPMYEPLRDISQDLLLPNLKDVPQNTASLLKEDHRFIEAYLVGANVAFGRELLYADYPTDQRLSSFRQFWDTRGYVPLPTDPQDADALREQLRDIPPIHQWRQRSLGTNPNRQDVTPGVILLVRGQLLQRYPTAVVYASEAVWDATKQQRVLGTLEKHPLFRGTLPPDVTFFGFDLTADAARGSQDRTKHQGWWFVFQQQPSEPRFGLDVAPEPFAIPLVKEWNDLSWANFAANEQALGALTFASALQQPSNLQITVGPDNADDASNRWTDASGRTDAAQVAYITLRRPVRVAIHAELMLPEASGP
jgi:hypothetical protein